MSNSADYRPADTLKGSEVFLGGLARHTTEDKIREVFSSCGQILEVRLIKDQQGNSKGFGFIRFRVKEAADKAVKEKDGSMVDGKQIGVLPSNEQNTLYLGNLHKDWTADEFDKIVRQAFPEVISVELAMPFSTGDTKFGQKQHNRGFAFVKFSSHAAAARAYRAGSQSDFLLAGNCHPAVQWAEQDPEVSPEILAKVKTAFVRNLPEDADENYLRKLFEPYGKLEKVVLSKKGRSPIGFVHFDRRPDLDNAIRQMNGRTVVGPNGGPSYALMVEVARPIEKSRKRARDDPESKQVSMILSQPKISRSDHTVGTFGAPKYATQEPKYSQEEHVLTDPYEAAVISLPTTVKERLLRILRLGIATRFDIDIRSLTSLRELPESNAISVLDQFMLSGADKHNKRDYLAGLISRYQVDKFGSSRPDLSFSRLGDVASTESRLSSFHSSVRLPAVDPLASRVPSTLSRYDSYVPLESRYTSLYSDGPLAGRSSFGKLDEINTPPLRRIQVSPPLRRIPGSPPLRRIPGSPPLHQTPGTPPLRRIAGSSTSYIKAGLDSQLLGSADHQSTRAQVRFDPYTGEPYKFDPFTGEPIVPESLSRRYGSPY